jgi:hypothetical protein
MLSEMFEIVGRADIVMLIDRHHYRTSRILISVKLERWQELIAFQSSPESLARWRPSLEPSIVTLSDKTFPKSLPCLVLPQPRSRRSSVQTRIALRTHPHPNAGRDRPNYVHRRQCCGALHHRQNYAIRRRY